MSRFLKYLNQDSRSWHFQKLVLTCRESLHTAHFEKSSRHVEKSRSQSWLVSTVETSRLRYLYSLYITKYWKNKCGFCFAISFQKASKNWNMFYKYKCCFAIGNLCSQKIIKLLPYDIYYFILKLLFDV
jgi:hypothetical protein